MPNPSKVIIITLSCCKVYLLIMQFQVALKQNCFSQALIPGVILYCSGQGNKDPQDPIKRVIVYSNNNDYQVTLTSFNFSDHPWAVTGCIL